MPDSNVMNQGILWAPWRHSYIMKNVRGRSRTVPKDRKCFLCEAWHSRADTRNHVLVRTGATLAILNRYPYNNGHIMIAPGRHIEDITRLSARESREMFENMQMIITALKKAMNPHGFNIGMNLGLVSGAGEKHVHLHVVPRWFGDTNFMPICASTKVISQSLREVYTALRKVL